MTTEAPPVEEPAAAPPPADDGWRTDANGQRFVAAKGRRGIVKQKGTETVQEALDRDARDRDQRPQRKGSGKTTKKPPPPRKTDLKELEALLADAFSSPSFVCASFGDQWGANHFTNQGPLLARNLVLSAQHNPWLRRKLEEAASGGDLMTKVLSLVGIAGAFIGYAFPPIVYYLNLPVPDKAREMFGIPDKPPPDVPYGPSPVSDAAAA